MRGVGRKSDSVGGPRQLSISKLSKNGELWRRKALPANIILATHVTNGMSAIRLTVFVRINIGEVKGGFIPS